MNAENFRKAFLLINFLVISALAVLIILQIWFEMWSNWDIVIKAISTYVVVLIAAFLFSQSEHIANLIFPKSDKKTDDPK